MVFPAAPALANAPEERDYLTATMPASEGAELGAASWLVSLSEDLAYAGIASQATIVAGEGISLIGDQKAAVMNSPVKEGYAHDGGATYPLFSLQCAWKTLDTAAQDVMFYVELPELGSEMRLNSVTCNSWSFWVDPAGMDYQYLAKDGSEWVNGKISTDGSKSLDLPEGFQGYVRLKVNTAANAAQFPDAALTVQEMTFLCDRFGGDYGAVKLTGLWFVSKEDYVKIKIGDGEVLEMTDPPKPVRDYLIATMPASEGAELGAASWLVSLSEDLAYAGIASQATIVAGEGISLIGDQKAAVINSPIKEGYYHEGGATYPLFSLQCAWKTLDTAMQDVMFYVELPELGSEMRLNSITCNSWSFWVDPAGMDYQYLAKDGSEWVNGKISTDGSKSLDLPEGFQGYVRLKVNTAANAAQFPDAALTVQEMTFLCDRFGGDYGAVKLTGLWFVSKEDYVKIQVGEGEVVEMTVEPTTEPTEPTTEPTEPTTEPTEPTTEPTEPTTEPTEPITEPTTEPTEPSADYLIGKVPAQEAADLGAASSMVIISEDPAWGGISSQATIKAAEGITIIGDQRSTWIDSPICEGYFSSAGATYPLLEANCGWSELDTASQDLMFHIELPANSSEIRLWAITCNGWTFWVSPNGMEYQYLSINGNKWESGKISTDGNKTLSLPQGFQGYVRLKVNTAENAAQFPDETLQVQNFSFRAELFGGDYGPVKLGGIWFVSKEDYTKIRVENGDILEMTNGEGPGSEPTEPETTEPETTEPETTEPETTESVRDYLIGKVPAQEAADIGAASSMVIISEDPAWGGISSQATIKAGKGITVIGDQKATVIDSPIQEGYLNSNGPTYPLFQVACGWNELDTATQDLMFYIELPANSSEIRLWAITCNGWTFWVSPNGMEYQYLSMDSNTWEDGVITTDGNKTLFLPKGFQGYVRLKVDTAENAAQFPDTVLQVQDFSFRADVFGGEYGPVKLGGIWFVSKENFTKIQIGENGAVNMTNVEPLEPETTEPETEPEIPVGEYITAVMPVQESAIAGTASSMVVISEDPAWAGITSQATIKADSGITIIGKQKATVIDSPVREGYFNSSGATYPLFEVNCGWSELDTKTQDLMFYIELPGASSEIRFWAITCDGWTFWVAPEGMQYQYLSMNSKTWENGTVSADGNKTIRLPQGFKGYVRLRINTAANADQFPNTKLLIQNFSFRLELFGGEYGPAKLGGVWFVSKEDYCHIKVDGGITKVMTNYWKNNDAALSQFYELLGQLKRMDLSAASLVDRLQRLYASMSEEYQAMIKKADLDKIERYAAAADLYRPQFLGVSMKKPGSLQQSLKVGWKADKAAATQCGYRIASCGAAMLFARNYDGSSLIDENTANVVMLEGKTVNGVCSAAGDIAKEDYREDVLIRCYVVYENIQTGEQVTVWCGSYTDQSGQSNPYLKCSLFEVANYFGVPLYAK